MGILVKGIQNFRILKGILVSWKNRISNSIFKRVNLEIMWTETYLTLELLSLWFVFSLLSSILNFQVLMLFFCDYYCVSWLCETDMTAHSGISFTWMLLKSPPSFCLNEDWGFGSTKKPGKSDTSSFSSSLGIGAICAEHVRGEGRGSLSSYEVTELKRWWWWWWINWFCFSASFCKSGTSFHVASHTGQTLVRAWEKEVTQGKWNAWSHFTV